VQNINNKPIPAGSRTEKMKTFYLQPTNGRKSFSNKCHVNQYKTEDGTEYSDLISYGTRVAHYNHSENFVSVYGYFSAATATHVNAFLDFYGFDPMTKKEMEARAEVSKATN
jgi:hypothetical protein